MDDYDAALEHYQRALTLDEQRAAHAPANRTAAFDVAIDLSNVAHVQAGRKRYADAMALYERSLAIRERLASSDPQDTLARAKVAYVQLQMGLVAKASGDRVAAVDRLRRAAALYETLDLANLDSHRYLARALGELGGLESDRARACAAADRAFELYSGLNEAERLVVDTPDPLRSVAPMAAGCGSAAARAWLRSAPH